MSRVPYTPRGSYSMNWRPKTLGVVTATAALLGMSATGAAAAPPDKEYYSFSAGGTDTSLCGFPIEIQSEVSGFEMVFYDKAGNIVRAGIHAKQRDTFSANGVTLVGEQYRTQLRVVLSGDEPVKFYASGVFEKVRLPDGSTFMGAGRIDVLAGLERGVEFFVEPDTGVLKNQDAFCAALSG